MHFGKAVLVIDDELSTIKGIERLTQGRDIQVLRFPDLTALQAWGEANAIGHGGTSPQLCLVVDVKYAAGILANATWIDPVRHPIICVGRDAVSLNQFPRLATGFFCLIEKPFTLDRMSATLDAALLEYTTRLASSHREASINHHFSSLTPRETEVCKWVVQGLPNKAISELLGITVKTVKAHRAKVMAKTGVGSLVELIRAYDVFHSQTGSDNAASH